MVEGTGLENQQVREDLVGSNPTPSASNYLNSFQTGFMATYSMPIPKAA